MENRPAPLRSRRVCRFCLTESEPLNFIYERDHSKPFQVPLTLQIMSCVAIEVYAADGMPQMICSMCRWNLDRSYKFKLRCKKADEALRAYPLTGFLPRPFPPLPNDPPETNNKRPLEQRSQNEGIKKPRVDNGDRERRETRERDRDKDRDRERDRDQERERDKDRDRERERERQAENEREKDEQHDFYEEEQDVGSEGDQDSKMIKEERKLEPGEIRVHACDQCDRTFPLRQALLLHVQRAHRDRNYKCTECDRMFFSKYDLAKHMTTHSEQKPFACPICNKQFSRANLLQRHEKVHRDELRYGCQHCDREFFTTEELEKHEDTVHKKEKPFQCNICNKRFTYKQGLERHEVLHNEDKTFVCEYCKEAFRTSTKLARHLTTHAGHRPYLCKLCPRTFLLSHHLTRHMRTHSVEKRHVCEDCGKAFKRKESLEVHQLTHTKRTGMGLTCDVCQESCRNRADYVTHIKQHIEAGEKMGPDGLQPDSKTKLELDSDEDEEEEQYSDGDDDYEPPAYIVKKLPKPSKSNESDDETERGDKEESQKEQVVFVRRKDGNMIKKTIKTLMPIQRREVQDTKVKPSLNSSQAQLGVKSVQSKTSEECAKSSRMDETEAQVQKIVASVFREHKIPLKHASPTQEQGKELSTKGTVQNQSSIKEEKLEIPSTISSTPKAVSTVKVIKRIVTRKPGGSTETTTSVPSLKEGDATGTTSQTSSTGHKVTKRVIVRRIIRQGDTTREIIMNPDGTIIDPAELAKLPTGNVVKRVVVKKPLDKHSNLIQAVLQPSTSQRQPTNTIKSNETVSNESQKFEVKTSQPASVSPPMAKVTATPAEKLASTGGDQETKEKLEQLEKRVEQQRLKIEELEARKQQEYEPIEELSPERHDESDDEQQLPLKRVFVKKKQSMYDEEQEYNDNDVTTTTPITTTLATTISTGTTATVTTPATVTMESTQGEPEKELPDIEMKEVENTQKEPVIPPKATSTPVATPRREGKPLITSSKVYGNKKIIVVKSDEVSEVEEMSRELCNILDSADSVVKMQESVLSNLSQMSTIGESSQKTYTDKPKAGPSKADDNTEGDHPRDDHDDRDGRDVRDDHGDNANHDDHNDDVEKRETVVEIQNEAEAPKLEDPEILTVDTSLESDFKKEPKSEDQVVVQPEQNSTLSLDEQDLSESTDIFEPSENVLDVQKSQLNDSVIELEHENHTISLNDTNDSQDSLEDKLQQMEG
ncbi:uncharacterized protein LOC128891676 isoform X1 [Hylaeus anthracinus]|uniref:uncharacterized protein LOC128891676 isoform X1 n=1 Tax=Hylaeus anthracinus TaxID=313031 RepID=UPI0023B99449|nr:uncharacterized protein LOC128891676 isoform X1 [Hylaeus anthracinus]